MQGKGKGSGRLEVITGPMFAGKSEELFRRLRRASIARERVLAVRPDTDVRSDPWTAQSHDGRSLPAHVVPHDAPPALERLVHDQAPEVLGLDEAQFFSEAFVPLIASLSRDVRVIVAGLDMDFRGVPFRCMADLMALADDVVKLSAICVRCGAPATRTQRLVEGAPAPRDMARILVGGEDRYEARCRACHEVP